MELFKILGKIAIDNAEANDALSETSGQAKKTADNINDMGKSGQNSGGKMSTAFSKMGSGLVKFGKVAMTGIAVAGTALGGLTVKALSAAGELEQNMGGSEAVFANYADKIQSKAKEAFSNMGLSTSDYLATANKMGALFQGAGFSIEESMNISSDAMQRAADVASIMGIDTSSAMEAIAGAAKGNFTMMDNLGVAMNDTTLNAYALEKGINKTTQEMTNQEKISLAMEMFMEKTAYAAGNYAKENETLAGSLGTAKAALQNFISGAGSVEDVVSSFTNTGKVIVKNIVDMFPSLMTGIVEIVNQLVPMIPPLLDSLLPGLIEGAVSLINGLVAALPTIINTLMGALPSLISGVQQIFDAVVMSLPQIMESLVSALPTLIPQLINGLVSMIVTLSTMLPQIIQPIIDYLPQIIVIVVETLLTNLPALIQGCITLIAGLATAFPQIVSGLWEAIKTSFTLLVSYLGEWFQPVADWFKSAWESFTGVVKTVWESIKNVISIAFQLIGSIISAAFQIITLPFRFIWENCKETIISVWELIKEKVSSAINAVKNILEPILNGIRNTFSTIWNAIKEKVSSVVNGVKDTVSNVFNNIKDKISNVVNGIKSIVTNTFNNVKDAMEKPISSARDKIKGIVDKIKGFFSGMKLSFPNVKLPHFSIKPKGWKIGDLLEGSIPKLGIDWYAKAMGKPMIMTKPTIFGYNSGTGQLMGGGEAGSEVVTGTNTLMQMISNAVANQNVGLIDVLYKILEAILSMDEGMGENLRDALANVSLKIGEREFGRIVNRTVSRTQVNEVRAGGAYV